MFVSAKSKFLAVAVMDKKIHQNKEGSHWYCYVVFDVTDPAEFREYVGKQVGIEQENGMSSYEIYVDDITSPKRATLIECFPDDSTQQMHLENLRTELFMAGIANPSITVLGDPPQATKERMLQYGFWPPAFTGPFQHFRSLKGFRSQ